MNWLRSGATLGELGKGLFPPPLEPAILFAFTAAAKAWTLVGLSLLVIVLAPEPGRSGLELPVGKPLFHNGTNLVGEPGFR